MASSINASTAGAGGVITTADNSGVLNLQSGGVTVATVQSSGLSLPTGSTFNAANTFGFKNRLINGAMVIDQRNAGASTTPSATGSFVYTLDRWGYYQSAASKCSIQQNAGSVTPPAGYQNYAGVTSLAATSVGSTDLYLFQQTIEGYNILDLNLGTANAKTFTFSFWIYSSLTGTFGGVLDNGAGGTAGTWMTYPFSYTINAANTWQQITITVPAQTTGGASLWNTSNGRGMRVTWSLGTGSSYLGTANAWTTTAGIYGVTGQSNFVSTNGATFYITGVQVEIGSQATSFDFRSIGQEYFLCQRYYCKAFDPLVKPADLTGGGAIYSTMVAYTTATSYVSTTYTFPAQMRANPTVAFYTVINGAGPNKWNYYAGGTWGAGDASVNVSSVTNLSVNMTGMSGLTAYNGYLVAGNFTASAEL